MVIVNYGRNLSLGLCVGSDWFMCKHIRYRHDVRILKGCLIVLACKDSNDPS